MKLWEILKDVVEGKVEKGARFKGLNLPISLELEFDGCDLVYSNLMGDVETRDTVSLCSGEIATDYIKLEA